MAGRPRETQECFTVRRHPALFVFALLVCAGILFKAGSSLRPYVDTPVRQLHIDRTHRDVDWGLLNGGLDQIHCFRDTGRWWTNTWCGGVPFWRPLTSYAFWGMRLLWPKEYLLPRQIILVALHLSFTALTAVLLWRLTRRPWLVLLTLYLFAGYRPQTPGEPQAYVLPVNDLLLDPKNIPDPLVGLATVGSLLLLINGRWLGALALAAASVGFKENGFTTWPLAVLVLGWMHRDRVLSPDGWSYIRERIRQNRLQIAAWVLSLLVLAVVHYLTVGFGYRQGTNSFWSWRVAVFLGCPALSNLFLFDRTAGFMSCSLFAAFVLTRRRRLIPKFLALLTAVTIGIFVDSRLLDVSWTLSAARVFVDWSNQWTTLLCLGGLAVVWWARGDWRHIAFGVFMALAAGAPSWMAAQTWAHTRYVASVFMELAVAAVVLRNIKNIGELLAGLVPVDASAHP